MKYQEFQKKPHLDEGCALFYRDAGESKYHILIPLETIPSFASDVDEIEYGYTTMKLNGTIKGRKSTTTGSTDFYWVRDFSNKLKSLKGREIDLLVILPDWQGYFLRGEVDYNYNEIDRNDLAKGTVSITPSWMDDEHTDDVRDLCMETAIVTNSIETSLEISLAEYGTNGLPIDLVLEPTNATVAISYNSQSYTKSGVSTVVGAVYTQPVSGESKGKLTITPKATGYDIIKISTSAEGYATWDTYISIEVVE